jgi:hypothetical protein
MCNPLYVIQDFVHMKELSWAPSGNAERTPRPARLPFGKEGFFALARKELALSLPKGALAGGVPNLIIPFTAFYMKKEIHVRPRLSNILVQKFFS